MQRFLLVEHTIFQFSRVSSRVHTHAQLASDRGILHTSQKHCIITSYVISSYVAALVKSHLNGLKPFERTTERTTETMLPSPQNNNSCCNDDKQNYKLTRAATLPHACEISNQSEYRKTVIFDGIQRSGITSNHGIKQLFNALSRYIQLSLVIFHHTHSLKGTPRKYKLQVNIPR